MATDFALIEQDPEGFCEQQTAETLQTYIDQACDLYYNSDNPESIRLSDYAYDCLVYWATKMAKKNSTMMAKIGAPPRAKNCCQLPYLMPSLDKVKIGRDLESALQHDQIHWSLKLDGISAMIIYHEGRPQRCFLRGNGIYGGDISFILEHIQLPTTTLYPNLVVRGELIVSKQFWKESFGQSSKATARNWVSGLLNSTFVSPYLRYIDFVAYQVIDMAPCEAFNVLSKEGFKVAKNGPLLNKLATHVLMLYKEETESYEYVIDGIVLSAQTETKQEPVMTELHNPRLTVAFKINLQEQMRETFITGIDWSITRHGRLVPVAEFRPVFIDGARIHRAFVYNASMCVKKYGLGVGTKIVVTRSGGVIPAIVKVLANEGVNPCLPTNEYPWHWSGCDIILDNPEQCPAVILRRYVHFFETLEISGIREGMLKRMMDSGFTSLKEIITAPKERLRMVSGIGPKRSETYYNGIREGLAQAHLYRFLLATNTFPSGIGKTFLRLIVKNLPVSAFQPTGAPVNPSVLMGLSGIGKVRAGKILEGIAAFKEYLKDFPIDLSQLKTQTITHPFITGKRFVLTGIDDDDSIEDFILDHGGIIASKVDAQTDAVITGKPLIFSEKQQTAYKMGIKIYTIGELGERSSPIAPSS